MLSQISNQITTLLIERRKISYRPSAHSTTGKSYWNIKNNIKYIKAIDDGSLSFYEEEILTNENKINEQILMGLRTSEGFQRQNYSQC